MNSKQKGDLAIAQAIHYYMSNGFEVCLPIGDKQPYDFIVEKGGILHRIQVKYAGMYGNKECKVALRVMGGNQSWHTAKKYKDDDFDYLFVYTANNRKFVLPWENIKPRNTLNIENIKYSEYEIFV